ncbi:MAG: (Fe-S)-binding protein [Nitrososphaerota archaeon]
MEQRLTHEEVTELSEALRCIRCGFCNSVCPTSLIPEAYKPSRTARGRMVLIQSALSGLNLDLFDGDVAELMDLCYGCNRCLAVCPAGIPIPDLIRSYRHALLKREGERERVIGFYTETLPQLFGLPGPLRRLLLSIAPKRLIAMYLGLATDVELPVPEGVEVREVMRRTGVLGGDDAELAYFADTYYRYVRPSSLEPLLHALRELGHKLSFPRQWDSGVLLWEYGDRDGLKALAERNVASLVREVERGRRVLTTSPAATLMLREVYPRILRTPEATSVSRAVVDVCELMLELSESVPERLAVRENAVTLHSSCFSQHLGLTPKLIGALEGLGVKVVAVRGECCGVGGLWGLLKRNRKTSLRVAERLISHLEGPVVTYSETCHLQLEGLCGPRVRLPFQLIAPRERRR